jgi:hypothetical protein
MLELTLGVKLEDVQITISVRRNYGKILAIREEICY